MRKEVYISLLVVFFGLFGQFSIASAITGTDSDGAFYTTATSTQIRWTTPTETFGNYLNYGTIPGTYSSSVSMPCDGTYTQVATTSHCVYLSNLQPGTIYYYKPIVTSTAGGTTSTSDIQEKTFTTLSLIAGTPTLPPSPTSVLATLNTSPATPIVINISWVDSSPNKTSFKIFRSVNGLTPTLLATISDVSLRSYQDQTVSPGSSYHYGIYTCSNTQCSTSATMSDVVVIPTIVLAPNAPTAVLAQISPSNPSNISVSWATTSANQTSFEITRSTTGGAITTLQSTIPHNQTSYTDSSVSSAAGTYTYGVKACNTAGCSPVSNTQITISTPVAPTPTSATLSASGLVTLSWTDNSTNETVFKIYRGTSTANSVFLIEKVADTTIYTDTTLPPATYYYSIAACNPLAGCSSRVYFTSSITIPTPTVSPITPTQPTNLKVATSSANSIVVSWGDATNETIYKIVRIPAAANLIERGANLTSYTDADLSPGVYSYTVQACNGATTCSLPVPAGSITIPTSIGKPISPNIKLVGINTVSVSWGDTVNETKYKIVRTPLTASPIELGANVISYPDTGLTLGASYAYTVEACNETVCSGSATAGSITIPLQTAVDETPSAPSSPQAMNFGFDDLPPVTISWKDNSSNETYFKISRSRMGGSFLELATTTANTISFQDKNILASTTYAYSIQACNGTKCSSAITTSPLTTPTGLVMAVKKVSGKVAFVSGTAVTDAEVVAYKKESGQWIGAATVNGNYELPLFSGTWELKVRPKNISTATWTANNSVNSVTFSTENTAESLVRNFTATPLNANLTVLVRDELNNPISGVGVTVDTLSSINKDTLTSTARKVTTETTNSAGQISISNQPGTYFIRTSTPESLHLVTSEEQSVSLVAGETKAITLTLKKETVSSTRIVFGVTKFDTETPTKALVYAWSDNGDRESTVSSETTGSFTLNLAVGKKWHIGANKDTSTGSYSSTELLIDTTTAISPVDLIFIKSKVEALPQTVTAQKPSTDTVTILVNDGASFSLPANAASNSGTITVQVKPTTEVPSYLASEVVGTVYDITVKNTSGVAVTKLSSEAEIIIPYNDEELLAEGITVESLIPSYFDENIRTWISVPKFTINKDKKFMVLKVDHLTRFALIASVDTTAPDSPTSIVTDAITPSDVKITWKNPVRDFSHSKIYRSEKLGTFGNIIAAEVFSNSFTDKTYSINGKTYYYTVHSVDAAGNESNNSNQIAFVSKNNGLAQVKKPTSLLLPPGQDSTGQIVRMLSLGSKGADVTALQKALKIDGFYATGPITGYYGKLTQNAVFRFQNYYKDELLTPNGYKKGTGVLGAITRKKINEILAKSAE